MRQALGVSSALLVLAACSSPKTIMERASLQQQVVETEQAFARTMSDRDFKAFKGFLSDEAVFLGGDRTFRGKAEVIAGWAPFYEGPTPRFSWAPGRVEVLDSGRLALSTGPVRDPKGKLIGTFTSVWRLESGGHWRILFDKGDPACEKP